jgi:hypothetical protein
MGLINAFLLQFKLPTLIITLGVNKPRILLFAVNQIIRDVPDFN